MKPELRIGSLQVEPPVLLAPMEGVTDRLFRRLLRRIGGLGLVFTEFVHAGGLLRGAPKLIDMARLEPGERAGIQLYGRDPGELAEAARIAQDLGALVVDLNMGCPSRKVVAHSGGSALLREPALVARIVRAMRAALEVPLTVKIRAGFSLAERNAVEIARICEGEGAQAVTVHWRTREEGFGGQRRLEDIRAVREAVSIPVIGNGDVVDVPSAREMLEETGCHGLMVGRGAIRNPWLPLELARWMEGLPPPRVTARDRRDFLFELAEGLRANFRSESGALGRFKMYCGYFTKGLASGAELRRRIFHSRSFDEALGHLERTFAELEERERAGAERGG